MSGACVCACVCVLVCVFVCLCLFYACPFLRVYVCLFAFVCPASSIDIALVCPIFSSIHAPLRYYNIIEDMKGKIRVYCRVRPFNKMEKEKASNPYNYIPFCVSIFIHFHCSGFGLRHIFPRRYDHRCSDVMHPSHPPAPTHYSSRSCQSIARDCCTQIPSFHTPRPHLPYPPKQHLTHPPPSPLSQVA